MAEEENGVRSGECCKNGENCFKDFCVYMVFFFVLIMCICCKEANERRDLVILLERSEWEWGFDIILF